MQLAWRCSTADALVDERGIRPLRRDDPALTGLATVAGGTVDDCLSAVATAQDALSASVAGEM